jgi:hypothetical protein
MRRTLSLLSVLVLLLGGLVFVPSQVLAAQGCGCEANCTGGSCSCSGGTSCRCACSALGNPGCLCV